MDEWHAGCSFVNRSVISGTGGGQAMKPLVTDALWERLQPLLPPPRRRTRGQVQELCALTWKSPSLTVKVC